MNLLRINDQILNADLIQSVKIQGNELTLYVTGRQILLRGEAARLMKRWLLNQARDLSESGTTQALQPASASASYGAMEAANSAITLFKMPVP